MTERTNKLIIWAAVLIALGVTALQLWQWYAQFPN